MLSGLLPLKDNHYNPRFQLSQLLDHNSFITKDARNRACAPPNKGMQIRPTDSSKVALNKKLTYIGWWAQPILTVFKWLI